MAEIDLQNETFAIYESAPNGLLILNWNEINELIKASHYLVKKSFPWIKDNCAQTIFYKQPFLEGCCINKCVFGCVNPLGKTALQLPNQIILVLCDAYTQSNFLWNNKPLAITAKALICDVNRVASKKPYQKIELKPINASSNKPGGQRYGDEILYDGPYDVIFD